MMKKNERRRTLFRSMKTRITTVFVFTTILMSLTSIFILITSRNLIEKMDDMFSANVQIEEFMNDMDQLDTYLTNYLMTDNSDSLLNYYRQRDAFRERAEKMFDASHGVYSEDDLIYKDIVFMVDSYFKQTDAAVEAKRFSDADEYIARYAQANQIASYITTYADRLNLSKVSVNTAQYIGMSEDLTKMSFTNIVLILSVVGLNILVISNLTYNMTGPIEKLAHSAQAISRGNFNAEDIIVNSEDELAVMANAFNGMKHSIRDYISALHDKADTESQLLEQQIENLKIQSLLVDAEIKALQMQINPHFLFNTLNAGVQLAMLEGAERTSVFMEDISRIFRYNVKSISRKVKIKEEIDTVRAYGNLFHVRFGDIIQFSYNIDCSLLDIDVPPLIIQPMVENAAIHGVGNLEEGGEISISLEQGPPGWAYVTIEDNGVGMNEETRLKILRGHTFESEKTGHTTGIGVHNVVQRLRLFFGDQDVFDISSQPGIGTCVTLKLPWDGTLAQPTGDDQN